MADLNWWKAKLDLWSSGSSEGCYPIVNTSTLSDNPDAIEFLVSDFSGPDGFGGLSGDKTTRRRFALLTSVICMLVVCLCFSLFVSNALVSIKLT